MSIKILFAQLFGTSNERAAARVKRGWPVYTIVIRRPIEAGISIVDGVAATEQHARATTEVLRAAGLDVRRSTAQDAHLYEDSTVVYTSVRIEDHDKAIGVLERVQKRVAPITQVSIVPGTVADAEAAEQERRADGRAIKNDAEDTTAHDDDKS